MKLTILNVAYPFAPVRPDTAGGAEQIMGILDAAQVDAGYKSIVLASKGSEVKGELIEFNYSHNNILDERSIELAHKEYKTLLDKIIKRHMFNLDRRIDLIHMHGIDFINYLPEIRIPVLVTLHLPPSWYPENISSTASNIYFNCVSSSQQAACHPLNNMLPYIDNGIPVEEMQVSTTKKNFAFCLGRICPEKGFHLAIDAAKSAGIPLILAGELYNYEYHISYYKQELLPRLQPGKYKFIGSIGKDRKTRLLSSARCLLVPSLVQETSSLVAMESIACGTPVIAFPSGALPDIIEDGVTGFIVNSVEQMADAIHKVNKLNPEICRNTAREKFSSKRMAENYFRYYDLIIHETSNIYQHD